MSAVSIIIPRLNEADSFVYLVERISSIMQAESITFEIILVGDESLGGTREEVSRLQKKCPIVLTCRNNKQGLANAIVEGAHTARYETIVVMDADFSHPPEDIPRLVQPLFLEKKDMAIGSRYTPGGETLDWPQRRRIASKLTSFPAQNLTGVDDPLSGFFAVSRERLLGINPDVPGCKICLELLVGQPTDLDVEEIPISFRDRLLGTPKMTGDRLKSYLLQLSDLCGLSVQAGFLRLFVALLFVGFMADIIVYNLCQTLGAHPLFSHGAAVISSFCAMVLAIRLMHPEKTNRLGIIYRQSIVLAFVLLWFFRIGSFVFIKNMQLAQIWPMLPSLAAALLWATAVSYALSGRFFRSGQTVINMSLSFRMKLIGVIAVSFGLRFLFAGSFELIKEEAYYWTYAQHLDFGYLDHPPMVALLIKVGTTIFGNSEFAVRVGSLVCWGLATFFVYSYTRDISNRDNALRAAAIMSVLPAFFMYGFFTTPDAPLIACWAGTLFFLRRALVGLNKKSWLGVGICLGLGLFSKYTIALFGPAIVAFLLIDKSSRHLFFRPYPYGAALLAFLIFSPVIFWNMEHEWASFLFQTQNRLEASSEFSSHEMLAYIIILLSPVGFCAALFFLFCRKKIISSREFAKRNYHFAFTITIVPLLIFFYFSLSKEVKFNWTSPVWLAAVPFMAITLSQKSKILTVKTRNRFIKAWDITAIVFFCAYGALFHYFSIGIPWVPYAGGGPLWGWENYAEQLDKMVDEIEQHTGKRPVIVGMDQYKTASGLAFYRTLDYEENVASVKTNPLRDTVGRNIIGNRSAVMYDYWFSPNDYKDIPLIMVSPSRSDLNDLWIKKELESLGDIQVFETTRNGENTGPLLYRLANAGDQGEKQYSYELR